MKHFLLARLVGVILLAPLPCLAQGMPSLQGYTGLLNTPDAFVIPEGCFDFLYSNQVDANLREPGRTADVDAFTFGMFPGTELGLRYTGIDGPGEPVVPGGPLVIEHLSGSLKVQVPFLPSWSPRIALGAEDVYGGRTKAIFRTEYGVLSQAYGPVCVSLGQGTGPARMKGTFGGAEWSLQPWLQVIGEYDTTDTNLGIRMATPPGALPWGLRLGMILKDSLDYQPRRFNLGVTLRIPLGMGPSNSRPSAVPRIAGPAVASAPSGSPASAPSSPLVLPSPPAFTPADVPLQSPPPSPQTAYPLVLAHVLTKLGFENVRTGFRDRCLVVEYENHRFNHNELDALGLIMGITVVGAPEGFERFLISIRKENIRVMEIEGPIAPFRAFFRSADPPGDDLTHALSVRHAESFRGSQDVTWSDEVENSGWLHSRLTLGPGLNTVIGAEVGPWNYILSLVPDLQTNLWPGAVLNYQWNIPLVWTRNYEPGAPFGSEGTQYSLERAWLSQVLPVAPGLMAQLGGGIYEEQTRGFMGDLLWSPGAGQHRFWLKAAEFQTSGQANQRVALGDYRYYFQPLNTFLEATAGRFYNGDRGGRFQVERYFNDTAVAVFYSHTQVQELGLSITLPLTPRRDMKPGYLQVKGTEAWNYGIRTEVQNGQNNFLMPSVALIPDTSVNLERSVYNNDRMSSIYLQGNLPRLREAYSLFRPLPSP
jgi:hypothetical protein